jgi:hypothetical protein
MDEILCLYLVAPKGFEEMTAVIIAPNARSAKDKMSSKPEVKELIDMGVKLVAVNITAGLAIQGYNITVSKTGMFH